jgi:hypothetical protein
VLVVRLRDLLPPSTLPARGDPSLPFQGSDLTPQYAPWLRAAMRALWEQGVPPFWSPHTKAGAPLFEVPDAGVLSLATALGALAPPDGAIKWALLAHVLIGAAGVYAFARALRAGPPFSALVAVSGSTSRVVPAMPTTRTFVPVASFSLPLVTASYSTRRFWTFN